MTINTESTKRTYAGNGVTTQFDYDFKIFVESDLRVSLVDDLTGIETLQALNVDYTITGEGFEAGGKATFITPPPAGTTVILLSNVPYTQPTDYKNQGRFFPETVENNFDRATRQILQLDERGDRSLTLPAQVTGVSTQLPVPEPGKVLGWALDGLSLTNYTNAGGGGGGGEVNTASNLGAGAGQVYASKVGVDLRFRSLKAGTNMVISQTATEITFDASGGGGGGGVWGAITGTIGAQTDLQTALSGKANTSHTHAQSDVTWLVTALGLKADTSAVSAALALKADLSALAASSGSSLVGFIRTGTGATSRTLQDRERDWISVRDYGAVGDGVTNDRTALVNADAAAFAAGKRLFFPAGTYMVSAHITGLKAAWYGEAGTTVKATSGLTLNTEAMLTWASVDDISIRDMAFDLQSRPVTVGSEGVIALINCGGFDITGCRVLNLTGSGIVLNGPRRFRIVGNFVSKAAASTTYNQSILVSSSSRQARYGYVAENYLLNSGTDFACVDCWITDNYIAGWAFGAGVTTEQDTANSLRYRITNNTIENSATTVDVNGYRPGGIENWGPYSVIAGNIIANCAGAGIDQGGQYSVVRDNIVLNNGTSGTDSTPGPQVAGGDGITSRYGNATFNGSYSIITNNYCGDTRESGDKLQGYGYSDQSSSIVGIQLYGNRYNDNFSGEENLLGLAGWALRPVSTGLDFKISTTGAGKVEYTCPVTFSGAVTFASPPTFSTLTTTTTITAGTEVIVASGNRVKLQGAANLTGIRYSSPNIDLYVGSSYAAGFGANTTGFNGATPVAKGTITGSRGGNAALASLLTYLASTGLITDSSS